MQHLVEPSAATDRARRTAGLAWWDCRRNHSVAVNSTRRRHESWFVASAATTSATAATARTRCRRGYLGGGSPGGAASQRHGRQQSNRVVMACRAGCRRTGISHGARNLERVTTGSAAELVTRHGNRISAVTVASATHSARDERNGHDTLRVSRNTDNLIFRWPEATRSKLGSSNQELKPSGRAPGGPVRLASVHPARVAAVAAPRTGGQ
jgi:hypothetical protein